MRGVINNPERARQINDFSGLTFGNITPTDADGIIEYHNKAYIFFEVKYGDTKLPLGQRIAFERLVTDLSSIGKKVIAIIAQHDVGDTSVSVDVASCMVRSFFWNGKWRPPEKEITAKEAMDIFLDTVDIKRVM